MKKETLTKGVGRGAEAGEGPLAELGEGEQKLREQPTEA